MTPPTHISGGGRDSWILPPPPRCKHCNLTMPSDPLTQHPIVFQNHPVESQKKSQTTSKNVIKKASMFFFRPISILVPGEERALKPTATSWKLLWTPCPHLAVFLLKFGPNAINAVVAARRREAHANNPAPDPRPTAVCVGAKGTWLSGGGGAEGRIGGGITVWQKNSAPPTMSGAKGARLVRGGSNMIGCRQWRRGCCIPQNPVRRQQAPPPTRRVGTENGRRGPTGREGGGENWQVSTGCQGLGAYNLLPSPVPPPLRKVVTLGKWQGRWCREVVRCFSL